MKTPNIPTEESLVDSSLLLDTLSTTLSPKVNHIYATTTSSPTRTGSSIPNQYRLTRRPDGTTSLQGAYGWSDSSGNYGSEWKEIPIVDIP